MRYVLAPLADFTDAPFRLMCFRGGADAAYTEMVSAAALFHGHDATRRLLETMPGEGPVGCQLFGSVPGELEFAAKLVEATGRFSEVNLNAGCPMQRITRSGAGAKLVESPEKVYSLLRAMTGAVKMPVTLKTRLGPRPDRVAVFELVDAAERAGCAGVVIHARFTSEMHSGPLHLDLLADAVSRTRLPVTGNGSVVDAASARRMAETGVKAIMVGRAALAKPWIFSVLKGLECGHDPVAACREHLGLILDYHDMLVKGKSYSHLPSRDAFAAIKMHTHLFRYFSGRPGAAALRARLSAVRTLDDVEREIASCNFG